jgi:hypothetical protein
MNRADVTELHYITAIANLPSILVRSVWEGEWEFHSILVSNDRECVSTIRVLLDS